MKNLGNLRNIFEVTIRVISFLKSASANLF